jgi:MOSC domain-containing protein YiiM
MREHGALEAIWIKPARGAPMDPAQQATLRAGAGLVGNANQGGKRQVTIISRERWTALTAQLGTEVEPSARRANLLVRGVKLADTAERVLQVGACRVRIRGETKPCSRMDAAHPGLRAVMIPEWGGGAYGEVLDDGEIAVGDAVRWIEEPGESK